MITDCLLGKMIFELLTSSVAEGPEELRLVGHPFVGFAGHDGFGSRVCWPLVLVLLRLLRSPNHRVQRQVLLVWVLRGVEQQEAAGGREMRRHLAETLQRLPAGGRLSGFSERRCAATGGGGGARVWECESIDIEKAPTMTGNLRDLSKIW